MRLLNEALHRRKISCMMQILYALLMVFICLLLLHFATRMGILEAIGASSLASSICILFVTPSSVTSTPRHLIGGYLIALILGLSGYYVCMWLGKITPHPGLFNLHLICAALAVTGAIFFMVIFDATHPPAAGFALGLVIEAWDIWTILILTVAILLLATIRYTLRSVLIDLV